MLWRRREVGRQVETNLGAAPLVAAHFEVAAKISDELADRREPQSARTAVRDVLGREQGQAGPREILPAHACPRVANGDADAGVTARRDARPSRSRDDELAAARHGVARVDREVQDGVLKIAEFAGDEEASTGGDDEQADLVAERNREGGRKAAQGIVDVEAAGDWDQGGR